jgi:CRISPR-associated protein Cas1
MTNRNLQEIPKFEDKWSFLYFEKGHIHLHLKSIGFYYLEKVVPIPVETINLLLLGPGTTITHEAIKRISECRCLVAWTGEQGVRFYSSGYAGTYSSKNLLEQARLFSDEEKRLEVVIRMYQKRFTGPLPENITIEQLRGKEGYRVRQTYSEFAEKYNIEWHGRNYDQGSWNNSDPVNKALSAGNATLYGIVHAAILASGFSPAIGFIHTGKQLSFVYDIADLYKTEFTIPLAFKCVSESSEHIEKEVRQSLRDEFKKEKLMKRIIPDIKEVLFGNIDSGEDPHEPEGRDVAINC